MIRATWLLFALNKYICYDKTNTRDRLIAVSVYIYIIFEVQITLFFLCSCSWPLAVIGKLIPVPETPLHKFFTRSPIFKFFTRIFCRRRQRAEVRIKAIYKFLSFKLLFICVYKLLMFFLFFTCCLSFRLVSRKCQWCAALLWILE